MSPIGWFDVEPGDCVLDVGFRDLVELRRIASQLGSTGFVLGIDTDPKVIDKALVDLESEPDDRIKVQQGSIIQVPTSDAAFDIIYCKGILHEVHYPERAFAELRRVCAEDGLVIIVDFQRFSRLRFELYRLKAKFLIGHCPDQHPGFSRDQITRTVSSVGFLVEEYGSLKEVWRMGSIEVNPFILKIRPDPDQPKVIAERQ